MMQRIGILFFIVLCPLFGLGQFEYFNQVIGVEGDSESEGTPDIELLEDGYMVWGGGVNSDEFYFLRKLDSNGTLLAEHRFGLEDGFIYVGAGSNFSFHEGFGFLSRAHVGSLGTRGLAMKSNENLDTLWLKYYQLYDDYTYFFTHTPFSDGYAIAGEYGLAPGERGTFIAKIDTAGEVLWHQSIHAPSEGVFRNTQISRLGNNFILTGGEIVGVNSETVGYIEVLNASGDLLWHQEGLGASISRSGMNHVITDEEHLYCIQPIAFEDVPGVSDPIWTYNKMRLYQVDPIVQELTIVGDYLEDEGWVRGGPVKSISVSNGIVFMGVFYESATSNLIKSFIGKLNQAFEIEWYTELFYDDCSSCDNRLYDLEQAPDGGYVMVGKFDNFDDPYDKTWLVKVDACGDLEWQGCENPNGLWEREPLEATRLEIWPNPASEHLRVGLPLSDQGQRWQSLQLIDITGKVVKEISNVQHSISNTSTGLSAGDQVEVSISDLNSGMYSVLLTTQDGVVYSGKVILE